MFEMLRVVVSYLAVLLAGLIAGLLFGTVLEQYQLRALPASAWVVARQSIDSVFSRVMPWLWNVTLLALLISTWGNGNSGRWMYLAAAVVLVIGIVVTIRVELPINRQITAMDPTAPPLNWAALRDRWNTFHLVRTVMGIASFALALIGMASH